MQVLNRFIIYNRKFCSKLEESFPTFFMGKTNSTDDLNNRIAKSLTDLKPRRIIEVGGIDRPLLTKNNDYEYIGIDIEFCENHYSIYDKFIVSSIEEKNDEKAELIISTTLLEHVKDNKKSLNTMYDSLTSGGEMHHYVP